MKLYLDTPSKLVPIEDIKYGFIAGENQDNQLQFTAVGKATFDQMADLLISTMMLIANTYDKQTDHKFQKEIYDRLVSSFSLAIHSFLPEVKDPDYVPENR